MGEGEAFDADGTLIPPGAKALADAGLQPLVLAPGEALALVSANAYSVGVGTLALVRLRHLAELADVALSLSLETIARYDGGGNLSRSPWQSRRPRRWTGSGSRLPLFAAF